MITELLNALGPALAIVGLAAETDLVHVKVSENLKIFRIARTTPGNESMYKDI